METSYGTRDLVFLLLVPRGPTRPAAPGGERLVDVRETNACLLLLATGEAGCSRNGARASGSGGSAGGLLGLADEVGENDDESSHMV